MSRFSFRRDRQQPPDGQMSLMEHLSELRMRIIRSGLAIVLGSILVIAFYNTLLGWMLEPYASLCQRQPAEYCGRSFDPDTGQVLLFNSDPVEGFATRLRIGFYGGVVLALPVLLSRNPSLRPSGLCSNTSTATPSGPPSHPVSPVLRPPRAYQWMLPTGWVFGRHTHP